MKKLKFGQSLGTSPRMTNLRVRGYVQMQLHDIYFVVMTLPLIAQDFEDETSVVCILDASSPIEILP